MRTALCRYQAERDRRALPMHPIVDRLASHQWDLTQVQQLLRELSSVMADDVEGIRAFDVEASVNRSTFPPPPPDSATTPGSYIRCGATMNVEIDLLGGFAVRVDGRPIPATEWRRRQAASLVKLLALAPPPYAAPGASDRRVVA